MYFALQVQYISLRMDQN